jgi:DNA modification methylase
MDETNEPHEGTSRHVPFNRSERQISFIAIADLAPAADNPRKHPRAQVRAIARSIEAFGFNAPLLVDKNRQIVAGNGRYEAAKLLGLSQVPVVLLDHLTETQARAYMLADNKLSDRSTWDDQKVAIHLKELSEIALDFDIEAIGFELPELDFRIQSLDVVDVADRADEFEVSQEPAVSRPGDLWILGDHRLYCGNSLDAVTCTTLMDGAKAAAAFVDAPYNVTIDGNVCNIGGRGSISHPEFAMAAGEMTEHEFTAFLSTSFTLMRDHTAPGSLIYICMDWRHMGEVLAAGRAADLELINLCIWAKSNGGMGSLYRSRHELVFVFRNGRHAHLNNIQLGRFGRSRTNIWNYPGASSFARKGSERGLALHPTVKPIALVSDAILDSTKRGDVVVERHRQASVYLQKRNVKAKQKLTNGSFTPKRTWPARPRLSPPLFALVGPCPLSSIVFCLL